MSQPTTTYSHNINGYDATRDAGNCRFDPKIAARVVKFIERYCTHIEGDLAGQAYVLPDWQRDIVGNLFGWIRPDGTRRFREAFVYVPRKNSKTTLLAGIALYGLMADAEAGAQVYSIAADKAQAALCYRIMSGMIGNNRELERRLKALPSFKTIEYSKSNSVYRALSHEAYTKHGLNPSLVISDELHAHPSRELIDVMRTGMGARRQPLICHITTADYHRPESPCNVLLDYARKVRDGVITDSSFLPALWYAEQGDDWKSESVWRKANPNYGLSVRPEFLAEQCTRAQNEPSYLNEFLRLHLNITTDSRTVWLPLDRWDKCLTDFNPDELRNVRAFGGLDLSATTDLTAFALYWDTGEVLVHYWMPEERAREREERDRVPYSRWIREGFVTATPGDVVDYQFIRKHINEQCKRFKIQSIGYDPWNATGLVQQMVEEDRLPLIEFRQGFASMSPAAKALEAMVIGGKLRVKPNPVLRWNVSNCMVDTDPAGNIKPTKQHSTGRIDGAVAVCMAIGLAANSPSKGTSIYETRGAIVL